MIKVQSGGISTLICWIWWICKHLRKVGGYNLGLNTLVNVQDNDNANGGVNFNGETQDFLVALDQRVQVLILKVLKFINANLPPYYALCYIDGSDGNKLSSLWLWKIKEKRL